MRKGHSHPLRGKARDLRAQGLTVREIALQLGLPRSSVGYMVMGVECVVTLTCSVCGQAFLFDRADRKPSKACPRARCREVARLRHGYNTPSKRGQYSREARGLPPEAASAAS